MKSLFLSLQILYFLTIFSSGFGQGFISAAGAGNSVLLETEYKAVDGSPYYFKDFKMGGITDKSGKTTSNLLVRYDSYKDEIQFLKDEKTMVVEPTLAAEFYFFSQDDERKSPIQLLFRNGYKVPGFSDKNYFHVLYDGTSKVLRKIRTDYIEETVNNYGTNEQVKRFVKTEFYFLIINGEATALSKNRKELFDYFGQHANSLKSFAKQNKLSVKNDNDVIKLVKKFDELNK